MKSAISIDNVRPLAPIRSQARNILLVDLNNFASFPTLAVGIITASLRNHGYRVQMISPLAYDVPAAERERAETFVDHLQRRIHLSTFAPLRAARDGLRRARDWYRNRPHPRVLSEVAKALRDKPDAILLSAYLQHHSTVREVGKLARDAGVPLVLGGPAFSQPGTIEAWRTIPGLSLIAGAESDLMLPSLISTLLDKGDLTAFPGVTLPEGPVRPAAPPLRNLDASPVPDFTDFPWDRYPVRIIPMMASRGCQWNKCNFCSDIVSVSGRTYRNRSLDSVLHEMREQAARHATQNFLFLDLKLNSNPALFRGIIENAQRVVRGAQWIGTVHVDLRPDNGLSRADLRAAASAGLRRVSFGLESGSQRMLDLMDKGCSVEANSQFIRHAHEAGISVRSTMFKGYPGETAEDLEMTADFLEAHLPYIDRIRYNEFSILSGTPIYERMIGNDEAYPSLHTLRTDDRNARLWYRNSETGGRAYRKAKSRVLDLVFAINKRKIRSSARVFDGLM